MTKTPRPIESQIENIITGSAARPGDIPRLLEAFKIGWSVLQVRAGDHTHVGGRLARLIVASGNRRPTLTSAELAERAVRMFNAPYDQE